MNKKTKEFWLATRDGIPCNAFETRREAIKWLKAILKQVSKDYDIQDSSDEFDYEVHLAKMDIERVNIREPYLGY